jgi:hypothetical protein
MAHMSQGNAGSLRRLGRCRRSLLSRLLADRLKVGMRLGLLGRHTLLVVVPQQPVEEVDRLVRDEPRGDKRAAVSKAAPECRPVNGRRRTAGSQR